MKAIFTFSLLLVSFFTFGQDFNRIASPGHAAAMASVPENITVSDSDVYKLGIQFVDVVDIIEVHFAVTDKVLKFSKTNKYVLGYEESKKMIAFGCLTPVYSANQEEFYKVNEMFYLPVDQDKLMPEGISLRN